MRIMSLLHILLITLAADPTTWTTIRELPAPEAHQAAAADEHSFYAITNKSIAKYDRETGLCTAISTGPAEHLNSGFLWEGKLYCTTRITRSCLSAARSRSSTRPRCSSQRFTTSATTAAA